MPSFQTFLGFSHTISFLVWYLDKATTTPFRSLLIYHSPVIYRKQCYNLFYWQFHKIKHKKKYVSCIYFVCVVW